MDSPRELVEMEDRWILPYGGLPVVQILVSYQLTLLLGGGAHVEMETEVLLTQGALTAPDAVPKRLDPERQDVAPALALFGSEVASAVAFKSGSLLLVFTSGIHLNVEPHPQYEAWNACRPGELRLVCCPGGELAIWR